MTTIDFKYDFDHCPSGIFRKLGMSLKFGKSFVHIKAKSRAIKVKNVWLALVSKFS